MALTDLTGTQWVINSNLTIAADTGRYYINFVSNGETYSKFFLGCDDDDSYNLPNRIYYSDDDYINILVYYNGWSNNSYKTITFTDGDTTNTDLIAWLEANATLISAPSASGTNHTKLGSLNITKKTVGGLEVLKEVMNGITVYEKGTTPSVSYEVEISFIESGAQYHKDYVRIFDGQDMDGEELFSDYSSGTTSSTTVTCTTGYLYVLFAGDSPYAYADTITGDISTTDEGDWLLFTVASDGTISIVVDYDM